jgi:hypothetical protein
MNLCNPEKAYCASLHIGSIDFDAEPASAQLIAKHIKLATRAGDLDFDAPASTRIPARLSNGH